jgi:4-amino-4-deoxy-L-arabinose transferase-like glycosyltransferase
LYNQTIFGTAIHTTEQAYLNSSTPLGEFSYPLYEGIYLNLISPLRGLLIFSTFLILGIFGYADMLRQKKYRVEALFLLACFLGVFLPYSAWYDPTGGAAFGPRFLISAIPFLLLPAGLVIETGNRSMRATAFILYAAGVVINGMAGITSALAPTQNYGTFPFLSSTLPGFLSGGIDVWWLSYVHSHWPIPAVLLIALAVTLPLISNRLLSRRGTQAETSSIPTMARDPSDFA